MDITSDFNDVVKGYLLERRLQENKPFVPGHTEIPVSGGRNIITDEDVITLMDCVLGKWYTDGKYSEKFRKQLHMYTGGSFVTLCNSGSSANLLALTAVKDFFCEPGKKKKVLTCATGFPTTVAPIIQNGLIPVFIDVDARTLNVDADDVIAAFESDPDIIGCIFAHTLGFPFDAETIANYLRDKGKFLIEDCCDALGATINGKHVGSFGQAATYSFFPAHHITSAEGGAVITNYKTIHDAIESYCNWGRDCYCKPGASNTCGKRFEQDAGSLPHGYDHKYIFSKVGYNLKMTDLQAALGYSQSLRLDDIVAQRQNNYNYLYYQLKAIVYDAEFVLGLPIASALGLSPSPFGFPMVLSSDIGNARKLASFLESRRIRTRPIFAGNLIRHPMIRGIEYEAQTFGRGKLSDSDYVMEYGLWVGCHPGMRQEELDYIVESIYDYLKENV